VSIIRETGKKVKWRLGGLPRKGGDQVGMRGGERGDGDRTGPDQCKILKLSAGYDWKGLK